MIFKAASISFNLNHQSMNITRTTIILSLKRGKTLSFSKGGLKDETYQAKISTKSCAKCCNPPLHAHALLLCLNNALQSLQSF